MTEDYKGLKGHQRSVVYVQGVGGISVAAKPYFVPTLQATPNMSAVINTIGWVCVIIWIIISL